MADTPDLQGQLARVEQEVGHLKERLKELDSGLKEVNDRKLPNVVQDAAFAKGAQSAHQFQLRLILWILGAAIVLVPTAVGLYGYKSLKDVEAQANETARRIAEQTARDTVPGEAREQVSKSIRDSDLPTAIADAAQVRALAKESAESSERIRNVRGELADLLESSKKFKFEERLGEIEKNQVHFKKISILVVPKLTERFLNPSKDGGDIADKFMNICLGRNTETNTRDFHDYFTLELPEDDAGKFKGAIVFLHERKSHGDHRLERNVEVKPGNVLRGFGREVVAVVESLAHTGELATKLRFELLYNGSSTNPFAPFKQPSGLGLIWWAHAIRRPAEGADYAVLDLLVFFRK